LGHRLLSTDPQTIDVSQGAHVSSPLWRRLAAEFLGTALLVTAVAGSGIMATRLSPTDVGLQLLENSTAIVFALTVLILIFSPISGGHFNPLVSIADWWLGGRHGDEGLSGTDVGAYAVTQIVGAIGGALLANEMFAVPFALSTKHRSDAHPWLSETVATAGLLLLVFALARTGRAVIAAPAVGAYIGAACWFTSSASFANPAVTIGRVFTNTFTGIAPTAVPRFIGGQLVGLVVGVGLVAVLYPPRHRSSWSGSTSMTSSALRTAMATAPRAREASCGHAGTPRSGFSPSENAPRPRTEPTRGRQPCRSPYACRL
jgi:glycerol uptake facilitator-like aquaporin